ncbi:ABC transporter permease [Polaromonas sp. C04]|nr:ABC transporter permease [Polaromonas sp. C04]
MLLMWQAVSQLGIGSPSLMKSPLQVLAALQRLFESGEILVNLWATMKAVVIALLLAAVVGTAAGLVLALHPRLEAALQPVISGLNSMPRVALAPVFVVAFGITLSAKVALAFSVVVFVFLLNARAGVKSADSDIIRMATVMGATKTQRFFTLLLPVATPSIFAATRLGLIYSLLGVVTSELIAARDGLGQLVAYYSSTFEMASVYAILIVLAIVAGVLNSLTGALENRVLRWQPHPEE